MKPQELMLHRSTFRKMSHHETITATLDPVLDERFQESIQIRATELSDRLESGWQIIHTSQCMDATSVNVVFVLYRADASLELDEVLLLNRVSEMATLEEEI